MENDVVLIQALNLPKSAEELAKSKKLTVVQVAARTPLPPSPRASIPTPAVVRPRPKKPSAPVQNLTVAQVRETKQDFEPTPAEFLARFGLIGNAIADCIPKFSFSLAGLGASFLVVGAGKHASSLTITKPSFLLSLPSRAVELKDKVDQPQLRTGGAIASPDGSSLWVCDEGRVLTFANDGAFLSAIVRGKQSYGIAADPFDQEVFITHRTHVGVYKRDGSAVRTFGCSGSGDGRFRGACGIALHGNFVLVVDEFNKCVQVFHRDGRFSRSMECKNGLKFPHGVTVNVKEGLVYVSDRQDSSVQVLDMNGRYMHKFGDRGLDHEKLKRPTGIALDRYGNLLVVDQQDARVLVFTCDGKYVTAFGSKGPAHDHSALQSPLDIHAHVDGRIFVSDVVHKRVSVFAFA